MQVQVFSHQIPPNRFSIEYIEIIENIDMVCKSLYISDLDTP